ncbi:hypothetical protein GOV04_04825 [Candidatus Woesearchaeota archaeon]|nr:hypothetical protein [Candidatus Woesearchaeota archaeon]
MSTLLFAIFASGISTQYFVYNETDIVKLSIDASDPDNDTLFVFYEQPLNETGEWQTDYQSAGRYDFNITVTDGDVESIVNVVVLVNNVDRSPTITEFSPTQENVIVKELESIEFGAQAQDPDFDDVLQFEWFLDDLKVADGQSYTYEPDYESQGDHIVKIVVTGAQLSASQSWSVETLQKNRLPIFEPVAQLVVYEGQTLTFERSAIDPDRDRLFYQFSEPFDKFGVWTATFDDASFYAAQVSVTDGFEIITREFIIEVVDVNRLPVFDGLQEVYNLQERSKWSIPVNFSDGDGDDVIISIEGLPAGSFFDDGILEWTPNYEVVQQNTALERLKGNTRTIEIVFVADDGIDVVRQPVKLIVADKNRAPIIEYINEIVVSEGETIVLNPVAIDHDGQPLKYYYSGFMDSNTKELTFDDAGEYIVKVLVSDGVNSDTITVDVTVLNTNRAPTIKSVRDRTINEGEQLIIDLKAEDVDGDSVIFSASQLPFGAVIDNNQFVWTPGYGQASNAQTIEYSITVLASDGEFASEETFSVSVKDVNRKPTITGFTPQFNSIDSVIGAPVIFEVQASDADGDALSYQWSFGLLEGPITNGTSILQKNFVITGQKTVKVTVSDGTNSVSKKWLVNVLEPVAPTITLQPVLFENIKETRVI